MPKELRIAAVVALAQNARAKLGKTQVQKLVYFLQDCGVPLEYEYEIYHYGPYSFDLARELNSLDSLGVLKVQSDPSGFGFDISVGKFADRFKLDPKYQKKVEKVVSQFGLNTAAELEAKATIHFVHSVVEEKKTTSGSMRSEVIKRVCALKPHFSKDFVKSCYVDLQRSEWI